MQLEHDDEDATGVICNGLKVSNDSSGDDTARQEELAILADEPTDQGSNAAVAMIVDKNKDYNDGRLL